MVQKSLIDYVKSLVQKGYDTPTIKNFLLKYGYSNKEIDEAVNSSYKLTVKHEIHLSRTTTLVAIFIVASLIGVVSFFYYSPSKPTKLLDVNLELVTPVVEPGQQIVFLKELSNMGSAKRYDVEVKQELIDTKTNKIIVQKTETRAIETLGSTQTKIMVPQDAKLGDYVLRVIVAYDDKKAVATSSVKVVASINPGTCFDGLESPNEDGIDCGGVCKPCGIQITECDDNNQCTDDIEEGGVCANKPIMPCCGNNICEEGENCDADCKKSEPLPLFSSGTLGDIKELAKVNPGKALQQCGQMEVPDLKDACIGNIGEVQLDKDYCAKIINARVKDLCYSNIAKNINDNTLCQHISTDSRKDSCYMTFVLDNKDYSVCGRISNKQLRQSCDSLKQLNEINRQNP